MTAKKLPIEEQRIVEERLEISRIRYEYVKTQPYIEHWKNLNIEDIEGETWVDIEGWNGVYQISNYERVKSLARFRVIEDRILVQVIDSSIGYRFLNFQTPKAKKYPHILMAKYFIPNPERLPFVNHVNGNEADCRIINLEWCTKRHNALHATRILGKKWAVKKGKGIDSPYSKKVIQKTLNGDVIKIWNSQTDVQRELRISQSNISAYCRGVSTYRHVGGFKWEFKT